MLFIGYAMEGNGCSPVSSLHITGLCSDYFHDCAAVWFNTLFCLQTYFA